MPPAQTAFLTLIILFLDMNIPATFPILNHYTYLNTANSGILSVELAQWRTKHDQEFIAGGSIFKMNQAYIYDELRGNIGKLVKAKKENVFLTQNFSVGFNNVINGLNKNHRFLILNEDYPSVLFPITSAGFECIQVDINAATEENIIAAIEKHKPTVFAFSVVQYISGYRLNPDFIIKLKAAYPDLLLIGDGTQFCGTTDFDFQSSGLDALITSGYKWLLAGYGNGFTVFSDQLKEQLFEDRKKAIIPAIPFLHGRDYLSLTFEPGHLDSLNFGSLNESIKMLLNLGLDNIEKHNQKLCDKARYELHNRGLIPDFLALQQYPSNIMSLPLAQTTVKKFEEAKIVCSPRGAGTRISFHVYNTDRDLNKLLEVIDTID